MNPKLGIIKQCIIKAYNREIKELHFYMTLLQKPVSNVTIHVDIKRRFRSTFATFEIDACQFFRSTRRNPIANAVYSFFHLQVYSNINHTCPYDHDVVVDSLRIADHINLPVPLGLGEYEIKTYWYVLKKLSVIINVNFMISE
ncbi:uncharacterized protein LOC115565735 [Drosophila navojoa]|uniref:uncharacterized protein LOC115565735 n=1 Tax=Drosophila navojoa TaxID=7232 RepID=UPI0011BECCD1|nr:uncharacterized protein LOC115565735 [Drosophila navojoa]